MESSAGPFSPRSAPKGGGLGALLSRVFALHSGAPAAPAEPQALPGSREPLLSRPPPGARAPYPAVLARPRRADTPDSKMASVGKHRGPIGACQAGSWSRPGAHRRTGRGGSRGAPVFAEGLRRARTRRAPDPLPGSRAARPFSALRPPLRAAAGRAKAGARRGQPGGASGLENAPPQDSLSPLLSSPR